MSALPEKSPVTIPVDEPTETMVPEELHVPPVVTELSVTPAPMQMPVGPVMAAGKGSTVAIDDLRQPVGNV